MRRGFSLVELSIVLVILGLLTGGILAGQSLIRAAELRAVVSEYQRYRTAVQSFRDKYISLPGDMINATAFWGKDNTNCASHTGTAMTPGACNGNNNGFVELTGTASSPTEGVQFWKQLALAGLIEGTYTGTLGAGSTFHLILGTNVPTSRLGNSGWMINAWNATAASDTEAITGFDYGNHFGIGGNRTNSTTTGQIFTPSEAWNIDTKIDDGRPSYGQVIPRYWNTACITGMATSSDLANGTYNLSNETKLCSIYFIRQF